MKKIKTYFWLKSAGLFSAIIVMLLGTTTSCRRHMYKYGAPPSYGHDETMTKYGVPIDYDEIDTTAIGSPNQQNYDNSITKYGVPVNYNFDENIKNPDTTSTD